jgi:hypothetical protein
MYLRNMVLEFGPNLPGSVYGELLLNTVMNLLAP